ncbi:MAG: SsrA-binding protein SmpB [Bacilli bacterium]|jgi:SsrA-binding protein|nr:SsrA-binding protein SmpB [Bacilli bacterium]MCH4235794.1 SsrA-binding protein SmpB [Bacilli bacterium]
MKTSGEKLISNNRKAHFNYFLSDFREAGIVLTGTEIKSLRLHSCDLNDAYVIFRSGAPYIINMHIAPYDKGNIFNHDPLRERKLLLHKREILKLAQEVKEQSVTVIPTRIYFKNGLAKVEIALGKGKKLYDKRETIKKRDDERAMAKAQKGSHD